MVYSMVNHDAARFNLPPFLASMRVMKPETPRPEVLVACLDSAACATCRKQNASCVFLDLGLKETQGIQRNRTDDAAIRGYWRVCNTRDFITRALLRMNISVLSVDVDAVFLANPLADLGTTPGVVRDIAPFAFGKSPFQAPNGDRLAFRFARWQINGGFAYYPASGGGLAIVDRLYRYLCTWPRDAQGDLREGIQAVMTRVFLEHYTAASVSGLPLPKVLPDDRYLNLCHLDCGSHAANRRARMALMVAELNALDADYSGTPGYEGCEPFARSRWIFMHTTCQHRVQNGTKSELKGQAQSAFSAWAHQADDKRKVR